ncbi:MAG: hypothetical protein ABIQ56_06970 [Chitinophagaceae bacterium]
MKKLLIFAASLFIVSGITFADNTKKKKKAKKSCIKKEGGCNWKEKASTVKL